MARTEVSGPSRQFTKIKELELVPEKAQEEEQEGGVRRAKEPPNPRVVETKCTYGALLTQISEGEQELVPAAMEDDGRHILTLQAVYPTFEDGELHQEGGPGMMPQAGSALPPLLWVREGNRQSLHQCVTISIQDELYSLRAVEPVQLQVLQDGMALAPEDSPCAESPPESPGLTKVRLVLKNGPLTWRFTEQTVLACLLCRIMYGQMSHTKIIPRKILESTCSF